jgi:type IV secretion system protein VirD4
VAVTRLVINNRKRILRRAKQWLILAGGLIPTFGIAFWDPESWTAGAIACAVAALVLLYLRKFKLMLLVAAAVGFSLWVANLDLESSRYIVAACLVVALLAYLTRDELAFISSNFGISIFSHGQGSLTPLGSRNRGQLMDLYTLFTEFKWQRGGILLGTLIPQHRPFGLLGWRWIGSSEKPHLMTIAGSQSGKGTAALIPNLLFYPGSALVIDPKGELTQATSARRGKGSATVTRCLNQQVFVLDPEDQVRSQSKARWNPLAEVHPSDPNAVDRVRKIGYALVPDDANNQNKYFQDMARELQIGVMLHVVSDPNIPADQKTLNGVRELIFNGDDRYFRQQQAACLRARTAMPFNDRFEALYHAMAQNAAFHGAIQRIAQSFVTMPADQVSNIRNDLQRFTTFLDIQGVRHLFSASDFVLRDLKRRPTTIYLCISGSGLTSTLKPLAHIFVEMAVQAMEIEKKRPPYDVLMALDEFDSLGKMDCIDKAMGLIAGYGVRLWPVLQSESQLKAVYGDHRADHFMSNCAVIQYVGDQGGQTARELESRLGTVSIKRKDGTTETRPVLDYAVLTNEYFSKQSRRSLVRFRQKYYASLELIDYYRSPRMKSLVEPIVGAIAPSTSMTWPGASMAIQKAAGAPPQGARRP